MTIKAIVFDIGGVLIRTEDRTHREDLESTYHLGPQGADELVFNSSAARASTIGKAPKEAIWNHVADTLDLTPQALESFQSAFWAGDVLDQSLMAYLQSLRPAYTTALLSNAWVGMRQILRNAYQISEAETVDCILISSEIGYAKPDPRIYQVLAQELNLSFDEIVFVDDFIENVLAAQRLGIHAVLYKPEMALLEKIESIL